MHLQLEPCLCSVKHLDFFKMLFFTFLPDHRIYATLCARTSSSPHQYSQTFFLFRQTSPHVAVIVFVSSSSASPFLWSRESSLSPCESCVLSSLLAVRATLLTLLLSLPNLSSSYINLQVAVNRTTLRFLSFSEHHSKLFSNFHFLSWSVNTRSADFFGMIILPQRNILHSTSFAIATPNET